MKCLTTLLIAVVMSLLAVVPSIAEQTLDFDLDVLREERRETQARYFMRALTQKRLNVAAEYMEDRQYGEARTKL